MTIFKVVFSLTSTISSDIMMLAFPCFDNGTNSASWPFYFLLGWMSSYIQAFVRQADATEVRIGEISARVMELAGAPELKALVW